MRHISLNVWACVKNRKCVGAVAGGGMYCEFQERESPPDLTREGDWYLLRKTLTRREKKMNITAFIMEQGLELKEGFFYYFFLKVWKIFFNLYIKMSNWRLQKVWVYSIKYPMKTSNGDWRSPEGGCTWMASADWAPWGRHNCQRSRNSSRLYSVSSNSCINVPHDA